MHEPLLTKQAEVIEKKIGGGLYGEAFKYGDKVVKIVDLEDEGNMNQTDFFQEIYLMGERGKEIPESLVKIFHFNRGTMTKSMKDELTELGSDKLSDKPVGHPIALWVMENVPTLWTDTDKVADEDDHQELYDLNDWAIENTNYQPMSDLHELKNLGVRSDDSMAVFDPHIDPADADPTYGFIHIAEGYEAEISQREVLARQNQGFDPIICDKCEDPAQHRYHRCQKHELIHFTHERKGKYEDMSVIELKEELKKRELPVSGKREELIARLKKDDMVKQYLGKDPYGSPYGEPRKKRTPWDFPERNPDSKWPKEKYKAEINPNEARARARAGIAPRKCERCEGFNIDSDATKQFNFCDICDDVVSEGITETKAGSVTQFLEIERRKKKKISQYDYWSKDELVDLCKERGIDYDREGGIIRMAIMIARLRIYDERKSKNAEGYEAEINPRELIVRQQKGIEPLTCDRCDENATDRFNFCPTCTSAFDTWVPGYPRPYERTLEAQMRELVMGWRRIHRNDGGPFFGSDHAQVAADQLEALLDGEAKESKKNADIYKEMGREELERMCLERDIPSPGLMPTEEMIEELEKWGRRVRFKNAESGENLYQGVSSNADTMAAEWEWERVPTSVGTGRGSEVRPIIKDGVWEDAKVRVYQYAPPGYLVFMEKTGPNYQAIVSTPAEQARIKEELKFGPLALLFGNFDGYKHRIRGIKGLANAKTQTIELLKGVVALEKGSKTANFREQIIRQRLGLQNLINEPVKFEVISLGNKIVVKATGRDFDPHEFLSFHKSKKQPIFLPPPPVG